MSDMNREELCEAISEFSQLLDHYGTVEDLLSKSEYDHAQVALFVLQSLMNQMRGIDGVNGWEWVNKSDGSRGCNIGYGRVSPIGV